MSSSSPNTMQWGLPKDIKHTQDVRSVQKITGTPGGTTQLTVQQLVVEATPPESGVHTLKLPPLTEWRNRFAVIYNLTPAPGGEVQVVYGEDGTTDPVGDNLSAQYDRVVLFNAQGEYLALIVDVTT